LGPNITNPALREDKLQKVKEGLFDERYVTMEIPNDLVDQKKYNSIDDLLKYLREYSFYFEGKV
jgi:hypothetical protein